MTTISKDRNIFTLINVFDVNRGCMDKFLEIQFRATKDFISKQPGFISANFHVSHDRTKCVNYAQWQSIDHFKQAFEKPEFQAEVVELLKICTPATAPYDIVECVEAPVHG